jgi:succinate dehydrogenase / fumarate reductase flavoprotein subunit
MNEIVKLREEFNRDVKITGGGETLNRELEKAARVADYLELGELMCIDALDRRESCGCHFREEFQTPDGEAQRNDEAYAYVAAWKWGRDGGAGADDGSGGSPLEWTLGREPLSFEFVKPTQRSYK